VLSPELSPNGVASQAQGCRPRLPWENGNWENGNATDATLKGLRQRPAKRRFTLRLRNPVGVELSTQHSLQRLPPSNRLPGQKKSPTCDHRDLESTPSNRPEDLNRSDHQPAPLPNAPRYITDPLLLVTRNQHPNEPSVAKGALLLRT